MTWGYRGTVRATSPTSLGSDQTLIFAPGETLKTIRVPLLHNTAAEGLETMRLVLSGASGGTFAKATATAVIVDDDTATAAPNITVDNVVVDENHDASVVVRLDTASNSTVSVDYATVSGTAAAGTDFVAGSGTLTFLPGEVAKTVRLGVVDNTLPEWSEQLFVALSNAAGATIGTSRATVTIVDDDAANAVNPLISIDDVWVNEGDAYAHFTVSLSAPSASAVSLTWASDGDTAS